MIFRNDYAVAGADEDGDGLSLALETSLHTCDRTTSPDPSPGFSCNARPGCALNADYTASAALCTNSLRDTDHDGLRDADELYGVDHPLLWLPLWGSDPAQMDVFVELDQQDQDPVAPLCQTVTSVNLLGGNATVDFFARVNDLYGDAPPSLNPNGAPGIRVHWDVGMAAPSAANTDYGNWGGGGDCVDPQSMSPVRVGYFHSALDLPGDAGGNGSLGGSTWAVGTVGGHAHELGHNGGLGHSGPSGSAGSADLDNGGFRANYPSRMNYRFTYVGGADGLDGAGWTRLSFSFGRWPALNLLGSPEICPMGSADLSGDVSVLTLGNPGEAVTWNAAAFGGTGCWNVDWDQSGGAPSGTTYHRATARIQRINRFSAIGHLTRPHRIHSAGDAAVVNDVLLFARPELESGSTFRVALRGDGADDDCVEYPINPRTRPPYTDIEDDTFSNVGSYPGCFRVGSTVYPTTAGGARIAADGVAISSAALPGGGRGLLLVTNLGGSLRWSRDTLVSSTGATEMTLSLAVRDASIGSGLAMSAGARDPALIQVPGTDETLVVYTTSTGALAQRSLAPAGSTWTSATTSTAGGSAIVMGTSPDLVVFGSDVYMSAATASGQVRLYRLATSGSPASVRTWTLVHTFPQYFTIRRPTLTVMSDPDTPASSRMILLLAGTDGVMYWGEGPLGSAGASPGEWAAPSGYYGGQIAIEAAAAVWDGRTTVASGLRNLRVFRYPSNPFGTTSCGSCPSGTTCTSPYPSFPVAVCMNGASGDVISNIELNPFPLGPLPGVYADYNDWRGLGIGLCRSVRAAADAECGTMLTWPEPLPGGGMGVIAGSTPADRALYPDLYDVEDVSCPGL